MPDNRVQLIVTLQPETRQQACAVLIDASAIDDFLTWLEINPDFERRLREERAYRIGVLATHLKQRQDWKRRDGTGLSDHLKRLNIDCIAYNAKNDEVIIEEVQWAYFGNDSTAQLSAELLVYGRQKSRDRRPVRVISRHSGFRSVPNINLYVFDLNDVGIVSDASLLREIAALNLHKKVREASYEYLQRHDYPTAILHAVNELFTYIRTISGLTEDGYSLIQRAIGGNAPKLLLNPFASDTEKKEQRGYAEFGYGVTDALRNVLSHHLADRDVLNERFGERHTALKFLCMLSLLFEKLDGAEVAS